MNTLDEIRSLWKAVSDLNLRLSGARGSAITTFIGLTDTPSLYVANKIVKSNAIPDALVFGADIEDLENVDSLVGQAGKYARVKALGAGIEWIAGAGGDVTAAANLGDDYITRGDGGAKGIQDGLLYLTDAGLLALNETLNAKMTIGITINQAGNDNEIFACKSSDVAHGFTTYTETDSFFVISKMSGIGGGALLRGLSDINMDAANIPTLDIMGATKNTGYTGAGLASTSVVQCLGLYGSGTTRSAAPAGMNVWSVRTYNNASAWVTLWIIKENGNAVLRGNLGINVAAPTAWINLPAGLNNNPPLKFTSGVALAAPEAGSMEYHDDRFYLTNVATQRAIDRSSDVIVATGTVENSNTEDTIWTGVIAANALRAGNVIKVFVYGEVTNATAADDLEVFVYIGATKVSSLVTVMGNVTDEPWHVKFTLTVRTIGGAGTVSSHTDIIMAANSVHDNDESIVIDTTIAEDVTVKIQWDNAKAGNICKATQGILEKKN